MAKEEKEKKEGELLIQALKDIRTLFKKDIRAILNITDSGIILTGITSMKNYDEEEEPEEDEFHVNFSEHKVEKLKASVTQLDYFG